MVTAYGANGDVGHSMTDEQQYRKIVNAAMEDQKYFISMIRPDDSSGVNHLLWLRLMGLAETWRMK